MKASKLLANLVFAAAATSACATTFANNNAFPAEPSMQKQGEDLTWLKDRFVTLEDKVLSSAVDQAAAAEFTVLKQVVLETAEKAASSSTKPSSALSQTMFFSGNSDCVFESTLAKIVNTQGRLQLGLPASECKGLTIDQIKRIDFAKIDFSSFQ